MALVNEKKGQKKGRCLNSSPITNKHRTTSTLNTGSLRKLTLKNVCTLKNDSLRNYLLNVLLSENLRNLKGDLHE